MSKAKKIGLVTALILLFFIYQPLAAGAGECISDGKYGDGGSCQKTLCCPGLECKMIDITTPYYNFLFGGVSTTTNKVPWCFKPTDPELSPDAEITPSSTIFKPQITIPGSIDIGGKIFQIVKDQGIEVTGDTFAAYMALFYRFFVAAIAVMAVVMIMWGGFKRIYAAGSQERISDANDTIISAIIGLVLALVSYSLLQLINPRLVTLPSITTDTIARQYLPWETEAQLYSQAAPVNMWQLEYDNAVNMGIFFNGRPGDHLLTDINLRDPLVSAANALVSKGYQMYITSSYRSPEDQQKEIDKNCPDDAEKSKDCSPPTCLMLNGPASCPHTTGRAVDVWSMKEGKICVNSILPSKTNLSGYCSTTAGRKKCAENVCQAALIEEMKKQGFCRLCREPWHFEKPKMSPDCTC